jgi:hypothetical protein
MSNGYYSHTTYPQTNAQGASSAMRAELDAMMSGFNLLPNPLGSGQQGFVGGQWNTPIVVGGIIDNAAIGSITPGPGAFTTLAAGGDITRDGLPTTKRAINFRSNGVNRAELYLSANETSGNGGSDIMLDTFSDAGALIATVMKIVRKTSAVVLAGGLSALSIDATPIGQNAAAAGSFTNFAASGTAVVSGAAFFGSSVEINGMAPHLYQTDTAQTGALGKFRIFNNSNQWGVQRNTAALGDYSTLSSPLFINASDTLILTRRPVFNGMNPWDSANLPNPVQTTGATFTGAVTFANTVTFSNQTAIVLDSGNTTVSAYLVFKANAYQPYMRSNASNSSIEFVNSANTVVNAQVFDNGTVTFPRARPNWVGLTPWDNGNLPNPAVTTGTTFSGQVDHNSTLRMLNANSIQLWSQSNGYFGVLRGDSAGLVGFINVSQSAWNMQIFDGGTVVFPRARPSWAGLTPWDNGNLTPAIYMVQRRGGTNRGYVVTDTDNRITFNWEGRVRVYVDDSNQGLLWTDTNFDPNGKAAAGAQVQWGSGVTELGPIGPNGGSTTTGDSAPFVQVGMRSCGGSSTANCIYIHVAWLRNQ